jgi:NAD(P)-dependent dehydrogenase (short-subunit alcohol dehydrogenase family)
MNGAYCASKHGVIGLVRAAAVDLADFGVRVNAICPGIIDTPLLGEGHANPQALRALADAHLLGRVGQPEEVARFVAFLASDDAAFVTAGAHTVDGGFVGGYDPPWLSAFRVRRAATKPGANE